MKRVVSLLFFALLLNSCDDGNLTLETISFDNVDTQSCSTNNIIYKLKEKEALLLQIDTTQLKTEPSLPNTPTILNINTTTNRLFYRFYDGKIATNNICETIPPATPLVKDQWIATDGEIKIFTTAIKSTNTTDNSTRITGYNHNIVFKNLTFLKSDGTPQKYIDFPFGNYVVQLDNTKSLPFNFSKELTQCPTSKQIYKYSSNESLTLNIDPALIVNAVTPLNSPKTGLITDTTNKLTYRLFSGLLTSDYFCQATDPTTPVISQEWNAVAGISNVNGIVEVTTTTNGTGFKHTIVLKKVTLKKGNNDFLLGDNFLFGELLTN